MNVQEINQGTLETIPHYVATALPLTLATIWIITASQSKYLFPRDSNIPFWKRLGWPVLLLRKRLSKDSYQSGVEGDGVPKLKQT